MNSDQRSSRRKVFRALCLLLLVGVALTLMWRFQQRHDETLSDMRCTQLDAADDAPRLQGTGPDHRANHDVMRESKEVPGEGDKVAPGRPAASHEETDSVGDASEVRSVNLSVQLVDSTGAAIPFVEFSYLFKSGFSTPDDSVFLGAKADISGVWTATCAPAGTFWLRFAGTGWSCAGIQSSSGGRVQSDLDLTAVMLTAATDQAIAVTLERQSRSRDLLIEAEYADGSPLQGDLVIGRFRDQARTERRGRFQKVPYVSVLPISVDSSTWLRISVHSVRGGYRALTSVDPSQSEVERGFLKIVIPEDPRQLEPGGVILDHSHFKEDQCVVVALVSKSGHFVGPRYVLEGPGETRSVHLAAGNVSSFMAVGTGIVWKSDPLHLRAGEWRRIKVEPSPAAYLTFLVTDQKGNPLASAVSSAEEVGHADWGSLGVAMTEDDEAEHEQPTPSTLIYFTREMTRDLADENGRIEFRSTFSGTRRFYVDAQGYEPAVIEVELKSGEPKDFGTVVLQPATGVIELVAVLPEGATGASYRVWLYDRGCSLFGHPVRVLESDGTTVIERIRQGNIQVFVNPHPGGRRGWWRMIEVRPGDRRTVTIDLTRDPGLQDD